MRVLLFNLLSSSILLSLVLASAWQLRSLDAAPVSHFTLTRRGGPFASTEFSTDNVNLTHLVEEQIKAESRFDLTKREVKGNKLVRKAKVNGGSGRGEGALMGQVAADGVWYATVKIGNPPQTIEMDLNMLVSDFYIVTTTSRLGSRYDEHFSQSNGPSGSTLGLAPSEYLSQTGSTSILKQLVDKEVIERPIFSLILVNDHEGVLSVGGTAARAVEMVVSQTKNELDHLGAIERGEEELPQKDMKPLVKRDRPRKEDAAQQADWEESWAWSKVQGADGWWQILMQSIWVDGSKVLQNQAVVLDVNSPFILAPPLAAKAFYASVSGSYPLQPPYSNFYAFPCLNPPKIAFEFGGQKFPFMHSPRGGFGDWNGLPGGRFSLGRLRLGSGYCVGAVVETRMGLKDDRNEVVNENRPGMRSGHDMGRLGGNGMRDVWVIGEGFFRGVGGVFDLHNKKLLAPVLRSLNEITFDSFIRRTDRAGERREKMDRRRKRELRDINARAWAGETDVFPLSSSLDSSLKKNTAFIKRLRTAITAASVPTFLQEIRSLSLHKYLSEVTSASYEGLCKVKTPGEIAAGIEIVSALHQRFGPAYFTGNLGWHMGKGLSTPEKAQLKNLSPESREKEEKERTARQRVLLKVVTELWLVGVLRSLDDVTRPEDATVKGKENVGGTTSRLGEAVNKKAVHAVSKSDGASDAEPFPLEVLKDLLGHDKEHVNLPLVVLFVKSFGWDVLGIKPAVFEGQKLLKADGEISVASDRMHENYDQSSADEDGVTASKGDDPPLTGPELRQRFKNVLNRYFQEVKSHIVRDNRAINAQGRRNAEAYVKSGEIFEDRQANFDRQLKAQDKLIANAQVLCDVLEDQEMPDLREKESSDATTGTGIGLVRTGDYLRGHGEGAGIWEDEEERRFYENLIDLQERVPAVLLEDSKKKKAEDDSQVGKKVEATGEAKTEDKISIPVASDDQSTAIANKTVGAQVDALLARLPELQTKDQIDQAATDFCFLNSKASRNRLLKAVQEVPKGRSDLLPSYSRLVATLGKYMPDVSSGLVSYLDDEFRSLQRRKQKDFLGQVRTGNIRYLAELTKFGVVPEHVIFHCLKVSLDDFSRMNIEIIGNLLENCGRYLFRNPDTAPRMISFLETLQRKKAAQHLGQQERMLIENALYYVNPPERAAIQQKERSPVDMYVSQLVYLDMNKRTYTKILKSLRKLHWEEQEVVSMLEKIFSKPWKVKYSNIYLLAILIGSLNRYHQDFVVMVIDNLLEQITFGLELNDFKFNQRRLAEVRYLGELYNYKMVDSSVIFDTLYRIVTFGHVDGTPTQDRLNPLDMPDDFFRIRLVCSMLDTCGMCFDRGAARKKLDFFLTFFQYYVYTKDALPMDIDFIVQDSFALIRPQWKLAANLEEAGRAFAVMVKHNNRPQEAGKPVETEEPEDDSSDGEGDDEDLRVPEMDDGQSSGDEADAEARSPFILQMDHVANGDTLHESDFEEEIVVTRQEEEHDPEAEAEFDRELQKMMSESLDSRKFDRKPVFDIPLPMRRAQRPQAAGSDGSENEEGDPPLVPSTMAFSLMTKKGSKQQTRTIEMPSNSHFAIAMKNQQEAEREEQQRIKNHILNLDLQDSTTDHTAHSNLIEGLGVAAEKHQHNASLTSRQPSNSAKTAVDKSGLNRRGERARKLQLSDVDWYDQTRESGSFRSFGGGIPYSLLRSLLMAAKAFPDLTANHSWLDA
ncbi:MAG: hypothetical protein Q9163_001006 [Psora crenata]